MSDTIILRIRLVGRDDKFTAISLPRAVYSAEIEVDPESGDARLASVYQNSGGALRVGDFVVPSDVVFRVER